MKIPSRLDGFVCGTVLSSLPSASTTIPSATKRSFARTADATTKALPKSPFRPIACAKSSLWLHSTFGLPPKSQHFRRAASYRQIRQNSSATASAVANPPGVGNAQPRSAQDKEFLLSLVQGEEEMNADDCFDFHRDPCRRGYAPADGPKLRVSERPPDVQYPSPDEICDLSNQTQELLLRFYATIAQRLRNPSRVPLGSIYKLYLRIPEPRMLHISGLWRNRLMRIMGTPRRRNSNSMLRYFALVADVKNAGLTLRLSQWNYAMAFAAKYTSRTTIKELEPTLRLWKEMEREANVSGNEVTFNILFDVAAKAGNYILADLIYREMDKRGIEFNRYHHVTLIHYFGLKLDSSGIRAAYREMVESGEMIDTVVLNCVIAGLLRCGEEGAVDETYERMKYYHSLAPDLPKRNYSLNKVITKALMMFSRVGKRYPNLKKGFQSQVRLSPDLRTYKLLVQHYAIKVGNIHKVVQYLDEMKHLNVPLHPTVFLALFKGFYLHGGFRGSDWSDARLRSVLAALYQQRDLHANQFRIDRWVVIWALRAVKKCSTEDTLAGTFASLARRWSIRADRQPFMHSFYENIRQGRDMMSPWGVWDAGTNRRSRKDGSWL
ncbi:hypothetical protein HIM_07907 [Hirsutella minnesotensis 3608]|uniref:Pentacotripeptide-repeat region of PRORP domain-containing protein n=1 Tax=Hirsutella minnesotensis 3608 TaxID=1043627 RepID=A0A0F7ZMW6_9HYPO|nr:hypothetical protein HIM_07907 [Hirsutella minnesotensis 3608]